jgi:ATP-GRASP peptide maturase of grasp-with-spasm system
MITIISMDGDHSTDDVIDWIKHFKADFTRINIVKGIENREFCFSKSNKKSILKTSKNKGWIRKLGMFRSLANYKEFLNAEKFEMTNYLYSELHAFRKLFLNSKTDWLCTPKSLTITKLEILDVAIKYGINIPDTSITNNKVSLVKKFKQYKGRMIVKSLTDSPFIEKSNNTFYPLTMRITSEDLQNIPTLFFPSLIQEEIEKEFEVRSFYINEKFYSTAIFSQTDKQTTLDFRNYNYKKPNRIVPYKLPDDFENRLTKLCKDCEINTGSFDLIFSKTGKFYFLEINQSGQFGMISNPCNYKLEKIIAQTLI